MGGWRIFQEKNGAVEKDKESTGTRTAVGERFAARHEFYRAAARVGSAPAVQPDRGGLAIPGGFRPAAERASGEATGADGCGGFGGAGPVCGGEHTLLHGFLSGKLEIQHQHSLRRGAQWRRTGSFRTSGDSILHPHTSDYSAAGPPPPP